MTNYNHGTLVGAALEAIVSQSLQPHEVVVVDDGSTDNSVEVVEKFVRRFSFVRLYRNEKNVGVLESGRRALAHATGDYVYAAAADDKILPGFFERSLELLARHPQASLCCTDTALSDGRTGALTERRLHLSEVSAYIAPIGLVALMKERDRHIWGNTVILRRSALAQAGNWIPELKWDTDLFAYWVIGFRTGICYIPEILACYRVTQSSYSSSSIGQWHAQRDICFRIVDIIHSQAYSDVLPHFRNSCVLARYGFNILGAALGSSKYRGLLSWRLIVRALRWEVWRQSSSLLPFAVKQFFKKFRDRPRTT